jgi:hypothetical protein
MKKIIEVLERKLSLNLLVSELRSHYKFAQETKRVDDAILLKAAATIIAIVNDGMMNEKRALIIKNAIEKIDM